MLSVNHSSKLQAEVKLMTRHIAKELIEEFGKSRAEAMNLIKASKVEQSLINDRLGFHESPYHWAISILTENNEVEALEKHFHH